jgi:hypothetical protein
MDLSRCRPRYQPAAPGLKEQQTTQCKRTLCESCTLRVYPSNWEQLYICQSARSIALAHWRRRAITCGNVRPRSGQRVCKSWHCKGLADTTCENLRVPLFAIRPRERDENARTPSQQPLHAIPTGLNRSARRDFRGLTVAEGMAAFWRSGAPIRDYLWKCPPLVAPRVCKSWHCEGRCRYTRSLVKMSPDLPRTRETPSQQLLHARVRLLLPKLELACFGK